MIQPVVLIFCLLLTSGIPSSGKYPPSRKTKRNRLHRLLSALAFRMTALAGHRRRVILVLTAMIAAIVTRSSDLTGAAFVRAFHDFSSQAPTPSEYPGPRLI